MTKKERKIRGFPVNGEGFRAVLKRRWGSVDAAAEALGVTHQGLYFMIGKSVITDCAAGQMLRHGIDVRDLISEIEAMKRPT